MPRRIFPRSYSQRNDDAPHEGMLRRLGSDWEVDEREHEVCTDVRWRDVISKIGSEYSEFTESELNSGVPRIKTTDRGENVLTDWLLDGDEVASIIGIGYGIEQSGIGDVDRIYLYRIAVLVTAAADLECRELDRDFTEKLTCQLLSTELGEDCSDVACRLDEWHGSHLVSRMQFPWKYGLAVKLMFRLWWPERQQQLRQLYRKLY